MQQYDTVALDNEICIRYCRKVADGKGLWYSSSSVLASCCSLTLKVLVTTIDAQWEGMRDVGSARYEPALLPPCPTIRVLSYSN